MKLDPDFRQGDELKRCSLPVTLIVIPANAGIQLHRDGEAGTR
jgi:hypothetical protein